MSAASPELSKELYEISRWDGFYRDGLSDDTRNLQRKADGLFPLYDLGYLLRKLPQEHEGAILQLWAISMVGWECGYPDGVTHIHSSAPNSEDAAAKLCVLLFKQNILKRDSPNV